MAIKCEHCGLVTHKKEALSCLLCGKPFHPLQLNQSPLGSQTSSRELSGVKKVSAKRNWYSSVIHHRAKGGIFTGVAMIVVGLLGGVFTKANAVVGGPELVGIGIFVLVFSSALIFATRTPK